MKKETQKPKRSKKFVIMIGILLVFVSAFVLFSNYGLVNRIKLENRKKELIEDFAEKEKSSDSLRKTVKLLKENKEEIERIAREKYGMIKPGEKVYVIKEKE